MSFGFDDLLAENNQAFDRFEEEVWLVYHPKGGVPRRIRAIIDRDPPAPITSASPIGRETPVSYSMKLSVRNHPIDGIDIRSFNAAVDRIDVPIVLGGTLTNRGFSSDKVEHDGGRIIVKVK